MRSKTSNWFVCRIAYDKQAGDGLTKKVKEQHVVQAISFTDAEGKIVFKTEGLSNLEVQEIDRAPYREIFFMETPEDSKWYKAKLQFITIDEKTEKEKKTSVTYLVEGTSLESARRNIDEVMAHSLIDYVIVGVNETPVIDVFEADGKTS